MRRNDKISSASIAPITSYNLPINDNSWEACVFTIYQDQSLNGEFNQGRLQQLCDWISNGSRQRFSVLQREDLIAWALENTKTFDLCKEIKVLLDSGTTDVDLPDATLARLAKLWMMVSKQEGVEYKNSVRCLNGSIDPSIPPSDSIDMTKSKQIRADKDKERAISLNFKKPLNGLTPTTSGVSLQGKGNTGGSMIGIGSALPKLPDSIRTEQATIVPDLSRRKTKLRDKIGKGDAKPIPIGDEPSDGPDVYYFLKDFDSQGFFKALIEDYLVPVSTIFHIEDTTAVNNTPATAMRQVVSPLGSTSSNLNPTWMDLRSIALKSAESSLWKQIAWCSIQPSETKDSKEFFDVIAYKLYGVLEKRKEYQYYYNNNISINIPDLNHSLTVNNDLRYYNHLMNAVYKYDAVNETLILTLLLEHLDKITLDIVTLEDDVIPASEPSVLQEASNQTIFDDISLYFDRMTLGFVSNSKDISDKTYLDDTKPQNLSTPISMDKQTNYKKLIRFNNENQFSVASLNAIESMSLCPVDLLGRITNCFSRNCFTHFLKGIPNLPEIDPAWLSRERILQKTEFHRVCSTKLVEPTLNQFLTLSELADLLQDKCANPNTTLSLHSWCWSEALDSDTLTQVLERAMLDRPDATAKFSKWRGALLLSISSPGPLGAFRHEVTRIVEVPTKIGFTMFHDLYDNISDPHGASPWQDSVLAPQISTLKLAPTILIAPSPTPINTSKLSGVTSLATSHLQCEPHPSYVYSGMDQIIRIQEKTQFLYPSGGIIIRAHSNISQILGENSSNVISWDNNTISFSCNITSKSYGAYFTASFEDGSVFSCSTTTTGFHSQASTRDGQIVEFLDNGCLKLHRGGRLEKQGMKPDAEISRIIIPMGTVVCYFEDKSSQILYADGSVAHQSRWGKITTVSCNGVKGEQLKKPSIIDSIDQTTQVEDFTFIGQYKVSKEQSVSSKRTVITREDMVTIDYLENGTIVTGHADGTKFTSVPLNGISIEVEALGKVKIQLLSAECKPEAPSRVFNVDWHKGTMDHTDIDGRVFTIDETGKADVQDTNIFTCPNPHSFGGKLLKAALKTADSKAELLGNIPRLFVIHPDGSGDELITDKSIQAYVRNYSDSFFQVNEEVAEDPASICVTYISKPSSAMTQDSLLIYRQICRHSQLDEIVRGKVNKEFKQFQERREHRSVPTILPNMVDENLGSTEDKHSEERIILGQKRAETEDAIILNYLLKEDFALRGAHTEVHAPITNNKEVLQNLYFERSPTNLSTPDINTIIKNADDFQFWRKPRVLHLDMHKKEHSSSTNISKSYYTPLKIESTNIKYFDSPEGQAFLLSQKKVDLESTINHVNDSFGNGSNIDLSQDRVSQVYSTILDKQQSALSVGTRPLSPVNPLQTKPTKFITPIPEKKIELHQPVLAQAENTSRPIQENRAATSSLGVGSRKLILPKSLRASRPGAEPNQRYLKQEVEARRQVRTASTTVIKNSNANYGLGGFVVFPAYCRFGTIMQSGMAKVVLTMTNLGIDSTRYTVRQPKNAGIRAEFRHGIVAPGMSVQLIMLLHGADAAKHSMAEESGNIKISDEIQIVSEREILHIPITAVIKL
ncbi:hypothetical protein BASA81_014778 [Batrachochytrium salamandrivorans]|nr:hypothetical protein BASA81_014778 [Batrachochytrium salamandrivorans]